MPARARREELNELTRTECKDAMAKCFESNYVKNWPDNVCDQIFQAVYQLELFLIEKLRRVRDGSDAEEDCICLLACFSYVWDPTSNYHERFASKTFPIATVNEQRLLLKEGVVFTVRRGTAGCALPLAPPRRARRADGLCR